MHILVKTDGTVVWPYPMDRLRADNPNTSYPAQMSDDELRELGVYPCTVQPMPQFDYTQTCFPIDPELVDGEWVQNWRVEDASPEDAAQRLEYQWSLVRGDRNRRLAETDWTQLPDAPVDASVWAEYRQALRDITDQEDPFNIIWPAEPGA